MTSVSAIAEEWSKSSLLDDEKGAAVQPKLALASISFSEAEVSADDTMFTHHDP